MDDLLRIDNNACIFRQYRFISLLDSNTTSHTGTESSLLLFLQQPYEVDLVERESYPKGTMPADGLEPGTLHFLSNT